MRHIGGLALHEHRFKGIADRREIPLLDEDASDVRAADGTARARNRQDLCLTDLIAEMLELLHHLAEARPARLCDIVELIDEFPVIDVDIVSQDVDFTRRMMRAELYPGDDVYPPRRVQAVLVEMADPFHGIVVRDGHVREASLLRLCHEFLRRQFAVRVRRVHMQITWHPDFTPKSSLDPSPEPPQRGSTISLIAVRSSPSILMSVKAGMQMRSTPCGATKPRAIATALTA